MEIVSSIRVADYIQSLRFVGIFGILLTRVALQS